MELDNTPCRDAAFPDSTYAMAGKSYYHFFKFLISLFLFLAAGLQLNNAATQQVYT